MKITRSQLKQIIKEELESAINEFDVLKHLKDVLDLIAKGTEESTDVAYQRIIKIVETADSGKYTTEEIPWPYGVEDFMDELEYVLDILAERTKQAYDFAYEKIKDIKDELEEIIEDEEERGDPMEFLRGLAAQKPFHKMTADLSVETFLSMLKDPRSPLGPIKKLEDIKPAYDKLYRIFDPTDTSHLGPNESIKRRAKMKITNSQLKQIIKEELEKVISEAEHKNPVGTLVSAELQAAGLPENTPLKAYGIIGSRDDLRFVLIPEDGNLYAANWRPGSKVHSTYAIIMPKDYKEIGMNAKGLQQGLEGMGLKQQTVSTAAG